ncbi:MAG: hypothetical protein A3A80_02745 [Candidatus Terrybacteria bacterium RIFCSPLOWO2_01_FULL_44_24]|uniref:Cytochrome oxidase subunit II copper A binding domain-containing protein n=1 Tax=Candidatus Terrybacteria bacterium RIFCSPHIGHO2_01_FULL_43_35 TaxID=1802361 RepID=A0A1G2PG54_9BACT|nr:MAG: hypothetical protein A2828_02535 [Candidatus Terrybacteria bacterium RIFCSPHIGHO2_01_FULL_43_35]OHA50262.1 MAG: hypothetical protein A3B75_00465 [Candidatus Terrybacteria bacterium RIFCSPHIGHO2_02_FULL_43_14]OHA50987.1 MAG: hypothetical protein A3A80_02745 [Candidatus Terrybacteria bacterium RIFCSPLOWO2_01_FULL_44_24]
MNKFKLMLIFGIFLLSNGFIYQKFYRPAEIAPIKESNKPPVVVEMRSDENKWHFNPDRVEVTAGDRVILKIYNEDSYDHGWATEALGINKRLFPKKETEIEFVASKIGEFPFYCSVPCGEGHYRQKGVLIVKPQD